MKKKSIMCGLIIFDVIILLVYGLLNFITYPMDKVNENKSLISIESVDPTDTAEIVKKINAASEKLSVDVAFEYINEDYNIDYFRTMND